MRAYDITRVMQDLTHLEWAEKTNTSANSGTFLKARVGVGARATYYKLSCYDPYRGVYGHECVNELVAARLMDILDVPHASARLLYGDVLVDGQSLQTWVFVSKSFRKTGESKMPLDMLFGLRRQQGEKPLDFCRRMGWQQEIRQMMAVDYLTGNRDRHGANIEVLRGRDGALRLAPLFDNGVSLLFSTYDDPVRVADFDVMADVQANNFLGTRSLEENLQFVFEDSEGTSPAVEPLFAGGLVESDREVLMAGLSGVVSDELLEAMWCMVWGRWQRLCQMGGWNG